MVNERVIVAKELVHEVVREYLCQVVRIVVPTGVRTCVCVGRADVSGACPSSP